MEYPEKILVLTIEDESDQAKLIKTLLKLKLQAEVDTASSCAEARELLAARTYNVITLDYQLPDGDGLEMLSEIAEGGSGTPVIMVTGHGDERVAVSAFERGAFSYVVKDRRLSTLLVDAVEKAVTHSSYLKTEKRLLEQRTLMKSALDSMEDIFLVLDLNGRFIAWNDSAKRKLGYTDEELATRKITDGRTGEELRAVLQGMQEALQDDYGSGFEVYLRARDGRRIPYEFSGALVRDADGNPIAISGIGRDISDRKRMEDDLKRSERRYRAIIEDQTELICRITADTYEFTFVNEAFCRYFNLTPEMVLGVAMLPVRKVGKEEAQKIAATLGMVAAGHEVNNSEQRIVLADGSVRWQIWTGRPIYGEDGRVLEIQAVGHDITDFKEAEQALLLSEEQFRELVENSLDLVGMMQPDGTIIYANSSVGRILGYNPKAVIGGNAFGYIHPDDLEKTVNTIQKALDNPEAEFYVTYRMRDIEGAYHYMETVGRGLKEPGREDRLLINARDISKRMEAEEAFRMSAARAETLATVSRQLAEVGLDYVKTLETIAKSLADHIGDNCVVLLLSEDGEYVNVAALEHHDPEAKKFALEVSRERWKLGSGAIGTVVRKGIPLRTDKFLPEYLPPEASRRIEPYRSMYGIYAAIAVPLRFGSRNVGVMILSRDRPDRPYTDEDQALLQDLADRAAMAIEMARLHKQISDELDKRMERERELEAANLELRGFAHNVSHDLKGPISTMKINLELLKERSASLSQEDARSMLESLLRNVGRAYALVENLLALAEAGQFPTSLTDVDVSRIVARVLEENEREIERRGIAVKVDDSLGVIRANPTHIYQVFSNLILNAIRHNDNPEPELVITALSGEGGSSHGYAVRDNGPGISPAIMDRLFEPFVRGEGGGTGIGLAIVHKVLMIYDGSIRARNDGGACFEFVIKDYAR